MIDRVFSNESCELANLRSITPVAKVICMHFLVRPTHFGRSCNNVDSRRSVTHSQCSAIQQKMLRQQTAMQWTSYAPRTRTCTRGHWICNSNITLRLLFNSAHRGSKKWRYGWWISLFALCQFALSFGFQRLKKLLFFIQPDSNIWNAKFTRHITKFRSLILTLSFIGAPQND